MVFSSIPVYLDPNSNWQQHQNLQLGSNTGSNEISQLPPLPQLQSPTYVGVGGGSDNTDMGSIRPGSMADRARLAKLPQPEQALKCPRCESSNTKFCYYNNYNHSQPRHFCKACRRYWTRGGTLRNVPVGGGCRRNNKKNKTKNHSKSLAAGSSTPIEVSVQNSEGQIGNLEQPHGHESSFITSMQNLTRFSGNGNNMGLNFNEIQPNNESHDHMGFQIGGNNNNMNFRQQFPFLGSFDTSTNLYPFHQNTQGIEAQAQMGGSECQLRNLSLTSARVSQMSHVTVEGNQGLNLSRSNLGGASENNNQFWGRSAWTDLSGLNSSSTNHLL